jgi:DHA1 family tetracycline resistance protein-like MFS transporter
MYLASRETWSGTVWIFTVAVYLACLPIILSIRKRAQRPVLQ